MMLVRAIDAMRCDHRQNIGARDLPERTDTMYSAP